MTRTATLAVVGKGFCLFRPALSPPFGRILLVALLHEQLVPVPEPSFLAQRQHDAGERLEALLQGRRNAP